jgi:AraC family transcriptional regulator
MTEDSGDEVVPTELIDYSSGVAPRSLSYAGRFSYGSVTVSRCVLGPTGGVKLGSTQLTVALHDGPPLDMEWRLPGSERLERRPIVRGDVHIHPPDELAFKRWRGTGRVLAIALARNFVEDAVREAFESDSLELRTTIGAQDPIISGMAPAWTQELTETGAGGRLYAESLGVALTIHLFRTYANRSVPLRPITGGLGPARLRRVLDYIEAHFTEDLTLATLAHTAGLSAHHFGEAFRESAGKPPYRFLIERRIHHGKELLLEGRKSIAEIAIAVGFATHSHFTLNFRKISGTTPSRFRLDRR